MDGNLVRTLFQNDGQLGTCRIDLRVNGPKERGNVFRWMYTNCNFCNYSPLGNKQLVHPAQTSYREEVDYDPVSRDLWVMEPIPGYARAASEQPAMSTRPLSWPEQWPVHFQTLMLSGMVIGSVILVVVL